MPEQRSGGNTEVAPLLESQRLHEDDVYPPDVEPESIDISHDRVYIQRYWVLALFSALALQQSAVWFTFASVSSDSKEYFGIESHDIDLLAMWGPIAFIFVVPFISYLMAQNFRRVVVMAAACEFLATFIRANFATGPDGVIYLHIGAIINGAVGCVVMCGPPSLSCLDMCFRAAR